MGTDAAGRRQYRYHDAWRVMRDAETGWRRRIRRRAQHATVLMAVALVVSATVPHSSSAINRAITRAYREVAEYMGNTPAVCRKSYVDPNVVELFEQGRTIAPDLEQLGSEPAYGLATQGPIEQAVVRLLSGDQRYGGARSTTAFS
jgi:DNA topoisomerase IB